MRCNSAAYIYELRIDCMGKVFAGMMEDGLIYVHMGVYDRMKIFEWEFRDVGVRKDRPLVVLKHSHPDST